MKTFSQSHYVRRARAKHNIIRQLLYVLRRYNIICIYTRTWPVARSRLIRFRSADSGGANNDSCTQSTNPYSIAAIKYKCTAGEGCRDRFSAWFRRGSYKLIFFFLHSSNAPLSFSRLFDRSRTRNQRVPCDNIRIVRLSVFHGLRIWKKVVYFHQSDFEIFNIKKFTKFHFFDFILRIKKKMNSNKYIICT